MAYIAAIRSNINMSYRRLSMSLYLIMLICGYISAYRNVHTAFRSRSQIERHCSLPSSGLRIGRTATMHKELSRESFKLFSAAYETTNSKSSKSFKSSTVIPSSPKNENKTYGHILVIMTFPRSSPDRIDNEAILQKAMSHARNDATLSIVLRCGDNLPHRTPLSSLRRYLGEVYSIAWDAACEKAVSEEGNSQYSANGSGLLDVIIYPQSLPNAAPEKWLILRPNLECICGTDFMMGWHSIAPSSNKYLNKSGGGWGGLSAHCDAVNADRSGHGLEPIEALLVNAPTSSAPSTDVIFLEDETDLESKASAHDELGESEAGNTNTDELLENDNSLGILGGVRMEDSSLFEAVAVGGTFDGLHFGHRKLLTLAVSSVDPNTGKLVVGVTSDEMLKNKELSSLIPPIDERIKGVKKFLDNLAPGLKNTRKVIAIDNAFGPPGRDPDFDALVLSHETLKNGLNLNEFRAYKGFPPMKLLCTQRTEPNSMSSTALRRMKKRKKDDDDTNFYMI
mmetsp:Transcript_55569/g.67017  ORF Transcript_55569/g.67017 Transcript_55569/m.67017 type:complete len:509 (+) Transcript_55569:71-1597(+)